jgi:two-component system, HptB-dependent secretion and biofilm response regulator
MSGTELKVLIADDNSSDRLILGTILRKEGHTVYVGQDGKEAVELFQQHQPDIVLLDAMMPIMDGYQAAIEIKKILGERFVPIIFLTSLTEIPALARCLEVGGDDFLTKPYNKIILQAKLKAFRRLQSLYATIEKQKNEIQIYNDHLMQEQEVAKKVFDNIAHPGCLDSDAFKSILSPMSIFNGDMVLAAEKPSGTVHILVGDFTGHGLPAAIGAMPVSEIFYGMTIKGFALADILIEVNNRLKAILPTGVFCCAIAAEFNPRESLLQAWNGGLPDGYLLKKGADEAVRIKSTHLPLGVLGEKQFNGKLDVYKMEEGDRLCVLTDGIVEAADAEGNLYGYDRVDNIIKDSINEDETKRFLVADLYRYCGELEQDDDITFLEFTATASGNIDNALENEIEMALLHKSPPQDWLLHYELRPITLRSIDPLPVIMQVLMESSGLEHYRSSIFTVLAELYSNALDHGVLGLDSKLKASIDGFAEYYQTRAERLSTLETGFVRVSIEQKATGSGGTLVIVVEDSGKGFDYSKLKSSADTAGYCGRGIPLLKNLCKTVEYKGAGNVVEAVFEW